jgi:tRNA dimethylallyltransferase
MLSVTNKKVFILLGPTSSGKTSLALELCNKFGGEIISADSRQVIKYMDIGTGKTPVDSNLDILKGDGVWAVNGTNIWGYDLVKPDEFFSGYDFAKFSLLKVREMLDQRKNVFIVGGTGFYIDLFTGSVKPSNVKPDKELRKSLDKYSLEEIQKKLRELDEKVFEAIDKKNKIRMMRAIEKAISKDIKEDSLPYLEDIEFIYIGLTSSRELLYRRADDWVEKIWNNGLVDEVRNLIGMGYKNSEKMSGLVYKTVVAFIEGKVSEKDAIERIKFDIHAYIRRQQTWFGRNKEVTWVDVSQDGFREIIYNMIGGK